VAAARAFGIAYRLDDTTYEQYKGFGLDLESTQGAKHHELPVPAVIIVDRAGVIRFLYTHPDYKVRLGGPKILTAAQRALK
jgi:hypothetical protein